MPRAPPRRGSHVSCGGVRLLVVAVPVAAAVAVARAGLDVARMARVAVGAVASAPESFSSPVAVDVGVEDVGMLVERSVEAVVGGSEVIWARPTPAAAAKASPTITPTRERRLNRLNRLCTLKSLSICGVWP